MPRMSGAPGVIVTFRICKVLSRTAVSLVDVQCEKSRVVRSGQILNICNDQNASALFVESDLAKELRRVDPASYVSYSRWADIRIIQFITSVVLYGKRGEEVMFRSLFVESHFHFKVAIAFVILRLRYRAAREKRVKRCLLV